MLYDAVNNFGMGVLACPRPPYLYVVCRYMEIFLTNIFRNFHNKNWKILGRDDFGRWGVRLTSGSQNKKYFRIALYCLLLVYLSTVFRYFVKNMFKRYERDDCDRGVFARLVILKMTNISRYVSIFLSAPNTPNIVW